MATQKIIESFNVEEAFIYDNTYLFIKGYATALRLTQTLKALPLARRFHDGQHRKGTIEFKGVTYKIPYVAHVLNVCSTLIALDLPLNHDELDVLCAAALLHDSIEDAHDYIKPNGNGTELMSEYGVSEEVYKIVKLLSKKPGSTEEQLDIYFNNIKKNKLALLIKLADRSHNVEDLYNMKHEKIHKYIEETRTWIYPLATYGKANYPELSNGITSIKAKIRSSTDNTEALVKLYNDELAKKDEIIASYASKNEELLKEIEKLKAKNK